MYVESEDLDFVDRQLTAHVEDNETDDVNVTTTASTASQTTMAPTETTVADADSCACPAPQVESTFTATLTFASADDLSALDLADYQAALVSTQSWQADSVVMVPVVKIGVDYTFDVAVTDVQCKAAAAVAFAVIEENVECMDTASAPSPAAAPGAAPAPAPAAPAPAATATTTTTPAARRLQALTKTVTISFADTVAAQTAATASQDATQFVDALAALATDPVTVVATVSASVSASVELTFTVSADAAIDEPTVAHLESAVSTSSTGTITVTAAVTSALETSYTRMPCSESNICGSGYDLAPDSATIGCAGAECTSAERDICCVTTPTNAGAQGTCVLGSLFSLLLWHSF
jgi:hypothetical protein